MRRTAVKRALVLLLAAAMAAMGLASVCHAGHDCCDPACCPVCQALRARRMLACIGGAAALLLTAALMTDRRRAMGGDAPRTAETPVTLRVQLRD